jgi:3-ketosteroid 9alpha-monooxygenase subunit B
MSESENDVASSTPRRAFRAVIAEITRETPDTVTLHLFVGEENRGYRAGQFLTIDPKQFPALVPLVAWMEHEKGAKEPPRAYSMASIPSDPYVSITVKVDGFRAGHDKYPPLLSPYLVDGCRVGQEFEAKGYMGHYVLDDGLPDDTHVLHLCAGSGIVPNFALIREALERGLPYRHTLLYGNRRFHDVIFRRQLDDLEARFADRLTVIHALTGEPDLAKLSRGRNVVKGRVDEALLRLHLGDSEKTRVYLCGPAITRWERLRAKAENRVAPPRFIESMIAALENCGIAKNRVVKEAFG